MAGVPYLAGCRDCGAETRPVPSSPLPVEGAGWWLRHPEHGRPEGGRCERSGAKVNDMEWLPERPCGERSVFDWSGEGPTCEHPAGHYGDHSFVRVDRVTYTRGHR